MNAKYAEREERKEATEYLKELLKPGDTVYTILRHVARSGMQREISLYAILGGRPKCLDLSASRVLARRIGKHDGLVIGGCGMDMGFALVYELSRKLYPEGFECIGSVESIGRRCPSNDHTNGQERTLHPEGGYALRHTWL